jgi:hypothetical protein
MSNACKTEQSYIQNGIKLHSDMPQPALGYWALLEYWALLGYRALLGYWALLGYRTLLGYWALFP